MANRKKPCKVGENKTPLVRRVPIACADEHAAAEFLEDCRWGKVPCCAECGSVDVYKMTDRKTGERNKDLRWRCRDCGKLYTVRTGTVMADTRIPLRYWCHAFWRACSSKKGVSAKQLQRETGLSYKSALFLLHRIRWAMANGHNGTPKLTGIVETDETYVGGKPRHKNRTEGSRKEFPKDGIKTQVIASVERGGRVRATARTDVEARNLHQILKDTVDLSAVLMTDEAYHYRRVGKEFADHQQVKHSAGEYARGNVSTNQVEGFFSLLKRGIYGTYHAVSRDHLHRYVDEFAFRYNTRDLDDGGRVQAAIRLSRGEKMG